MIDRRALLAASAAVLTPQSVAAGPNRDPGPGRGPWAHGRPRDHGLSIEALETAAAAIGATGERQGLVVVRDGVICKAKLPPKPAPKVTTHR